MSRVFRYFSIGVLCSVVLIPAPLFARTANDPFVEQWAYRDTGVYEAWDSAIGSRDVIVAVIDDGFDTFHPDLSENVWINRGEISNNGIDDDHNGYIDDVWGWNFAAEDRNGDGVISPEEEAGNNDPRPSAVGATDVERKEGAIHHGTVVAGIIGATGNNGQYGVGINWRVRLMNIKVLGNKGNGELTRLGEAIRYAVDNGADIINFSVVGPSMTRDIRDAITYAYDHGVAMVAAAGNNLQFLNDTPFYPVCADKALGPSVNRVLGVSAITELHSIAIFSNTGSDCIDLTAPGVNISSTMRYAPQFGFDKAYGGMWNGTSFATPIVSGALALIKSMQPTWKAPQLYEAVLKTVHKTPPQNEQDYANLFGKGLIQIHDAVAYALAQKIVKPFMSAIGWVDASSGNVYTYDNETDEGGVIQKNVLRNSIAIKSFSTDDEQGYVTVSRVNDDMVEVHVLSPDWALKSSWQTFLKGDVSFAVGNILENNGVEIVMGSDQDDVLSIFSTDGYRYTTIPTHKQGSSISLATILGQDGYDDIVAVFRYNEVMTLQWFTGQGRLLRLIPLRNVTMRAEVETGDVNGDGEQEMIVVGGPGEEPIIMTLQQDGTLLYAVLGYEPGMRTGLRLMVRDYTIDGVDEVLVAPSDGSDRIRVWQGTRIIAQPNIGQGQSGLLIPVLK